MLWPGAAHGFLRGVRRRGARSTTSRYKFDGIYVEHGQQYEQFAAIDMQRPFITRRLARAGAESAVGLALRRGPAAQDQAGASARRQGAAVLGVSALGARSTIFSGASRRRSASSSSCSTRCCSGGATRSSQGVARDASGCSKEITLYPNYDKIAFKILEENPDINTVIFGHTHILRYRQWREGKEYFNEGTWNETTNLDLDDYGKQIRLTYAFIEYPLIAPSEAPLGQAAPTPESQAQAVEWRLEARGGRAGVRAPLPDRSSERRPKCEVWRPSTDFRRDRNRARYKAMPSGIFGRG